MVNVLPKTLDPKSTLKQVQINKSSVESQVKAIISNNPVSDSKLVFNYWLLKAITVIDLTTLAGDDTRSNVLRLCSVAASPISAELLKKFGIEEQIRTAAVCVYPNRVADAHFAITELGLPQAINIASVATGFPSGLYPLSTRLLEIKTAVRNGATEIDVVLDRSLVLMGKWSEVFKEVELMKEACGLAHMKVILGVGELGTYENVYYASMASMMAGADFIKTSTGKEAVNATLPVGLVMCRAIRRFYQMTGKKVGLKPAGGIKTPEDAVNWLLLVQTELGNEWLSPKLFRIGASSLLTVIVDRLKNVGLKPAGGIKTPEDAVNWLLLVQTELGNEWLSPKLFRIGASSLLTVIVDRLKNSN